MKKYKIFQQYYISKVLVALLIVTAILSSCVWTEKQVEERRNLAFSAVEDAEYWIITEGIGQYYQNDKHFSVIKNYLTSKDIGSYYGDVTHDEIRFIDHIMMERMPFLARMSCFARITYMEKLYEYWVVDLFSFRRDINRNQIKFLVLEAESLASKRTIIHESDKFFSSYSNFEGLSIKFPLHQVQSVELIEPWRYPASFKETELEGMMRGDGTRMLWIDKSYREKAISLDMKEAAKKLETDNILRMLWQFRSLSKENTTPEIKIAATNFIYEFYNNVKEDEEGALKSSLKNRKWWDDVDVFMDMRKKWYSPTQRIEIKRIMTSRDVENFIYVEVDEWRKPKKLPEILEHYYFILTITGKGKLKLSGFWQYNFPEWPVRSTDR